PMLSSLQSEPATNSKSRSADLVRQARNWKKAIFAEGSVHGLNVYRTTALGRKADAGRARPKSAQLQI
ncbi:MAG TPA: hypothetical protein VK638_05560, partial [Edaphobacter sp.]|nr:hypothetical protein [Edaphobacter sp.]